MQGNELVSPGGDGGPGAAVLLERNSSSIEVLDNVVVSSTLPEANAAANVVIDGNELR